MRIGIGLPNQIREVDAAILPGWAAQAEIDRLAEVVL
jgi:hypothetical protein